MRRTRKRYQEDHVFRSLVDVLASHFRINLNYTKREVMDAVAEAEAIVKERGGKQYIHHEQAEQENVVAMG